jgi:hypothetical protein
MVQHHFERFMVATMTCFIMANIFVAMYPGSVTRTVSTSDKDKKKNKDLQNTSQKTKDRAILSPIKSRINSDTQGG